MGFGNGGTTNSAPTSTGCAATTISDGALLTAYKTNAASADSEYTGKTICVTGSVDSVESYNGNYASCVYEPELPPSQRGIQFPGCTGMSQYSVSYGGSLEWVEFVWASSSGASAVPTDTTFVAQCRVSGVQNQVTLVLGGCGIS